MTYSLFSDLKIRRLQPETMDAPDVDPKIHEDALKGLARINFISLAAKALWDPIKEIAKKNTAKRSLKILDVASGGGDVAIRLKQISEKEKIAVEVFGCDKSRTAVEYAQKRAASLKIDVKFFQHDIFQDVPPFSADVVTCTLFLHHLTEEEALRWMLQLKQNQVPTVIVQDIERSLLGFIAAFLGPRLLTRSSMVHDDAVQSVRNAFRIQEVKDLADQAKWEKAAVRKIWPFRFQLTGTPGGFESP